MPSEIQSTYLGNTPVKEERKVNYTEDYKTTQLTSNIIIREKYDGKEFTGIRYGAKLDYVPSYRTTVYAEPEQLPVYEEP